MRTTVQRWYIILNPSAPDVIKRSESRDVIFAATLLEDLDVMGVFMKHCVATLC